jgi:hypothetical protein
VFDRIDKHHTGVVDDGVDPTKTVDGLVHSGDCLRPLRDVGSDRQSRAGSLLNVAGKLFKPVPAPGDKSDRRPVRGKRSGDRFAKSAARAGYQGNRSI